MYEKHYVKNIIVQVQDLWESSLSKQTGLLEGHVLNHCIANSTGSWSC